MDSLDRTITAELEGSGPEQALLFIGPQRIPRMEVTEAMKARLQRSMRRIFYMTYALPFMLVGDEISELVRGAKGKVIPFADPPELYKAVRRISEEMNQPLATAGISPSGPGLPSR
jgi:hypothetical protein